MTIDEVVGRCWSSPQRVSRRNDGAGVQAGRRFAVDLISMAPRGTRGSINSPSREWTKGRDNGPQSAPEVRMTESFAQLFEESLASQKIQARRRS